jgi:hypothetical protein
VVVRRNRIHNLQKGIFIEWKGGADRSNDTRIEFNEIYDPTLGDWPWSAVKGTVMDGTGVILRGHIGAIVRGNDIHHFFNGIYVGSSAALEDSGLAFDADIYNNHFQYIGDDVFEPEGACINVRFRNNTANSVFVAVSLAPITQGPTWVLRSLFTNITGRGVKWDRNSDGVVLIYHNTFWTDAQNVNMMDLISPVHNAVMRNNILRGNAYAFQEAPTSSSGHDWNNDNWSSTRPAGSPRYKWHNVTYNTLAAVCAATGLECNGYEDPPGLVNPGGGDFTLLATSPNIDRGVLIPGINDTFSGSAPDVGAFESVVDQPPAVSSSVRADADPTNAASVRFTVTFSEAVTGVDTTAPFNDFLLSVSPGLSGASVASVSPVSASTYTVVVNTGTGNGSLRLDVADDDSIVDAVSNPLGGAGAGNGNFAAGESYTVNMGLLAVTAILPADPTPSTADSVHFAVTFSQDVGGVDVGDFALATTGGISGTAISEVTGSGSAYAVTVNTGSGDGTLRLDLVDNDSIADASAKPLGGVGAGNGSYTAGGVYTIDRSSPLLLSSQRTEADPTAATVVNFRVTFSEPVSGVDASDFTLSVTGAISGAGITSIGIGDLGRTYLVAVNTGSGDGTLRLDVLDDDSILDSVGRPLGGDGAGNGNFAGGEVYTVSKPTFTTLVETFASSSSNDGWVLESAEDSDKGGSKNSNATTINLGDDARDRQYRAILHFSTASIPDNAVITVVILTIRRQGLVGSDPFGSLHNILIDIRQGPFGSFGPFAISGLQVSDFQAPPSRNAVGEIHNNPVDGWYWALLDTTANPSINLAGATQLRLRFQSDDNDNRVADYLKFYSGNYKSLSDRPQLRIEYYVPR